MQPFIKSTVQLKNKKKLGILPSIFIFLQIGMKIKNYKHQKINQIYLLTLNCLF